MVRTILALVCFLFLSGESMYAGRGSKKDATPFKDATEEGLPSTVKSKTDPYVAAQSLTSALNWVLVDSMANAFGPANDNITPISFDPTSGVVALIHRGHTSYASGSGQLWYNYSTDGGATWIRVSELNGGTPTNTRYPSAALWNALSSPNPGDMLFVYSAPALHPSGSGFGGITYGFDLFGAGGPSATLDYGSDSTYTSSSTIWTVPNSPWVFWATTKSTPSPNHSHFWGTNDYITIANQTPASWRDTLPNFVNAISHISGSATASGGSYYSVNALWPDDSADAFNTGYSKTTDNGTTWGPWTRPQPDWMRATGLPVRYDLYDYVQPAGGTVAYLNEMVVDANDKVHFFSVVVDSPWTNLDERSILEVYEDAGATSGWSSKWVTTGMNVNTPLAYGTLDQTRNAIHASISTDRQVMTMVWIDAEPGDSIPDIWFSSRDINGASWSTPENISQTPNLGEILLHAAPQVRVNGGGSYTLFLGRTYEAGFPSFSNLNASNPCYFYIAEHTFAVTSVGDRVDLPNKFELAQNYPNPFNPSTKIKFVIPQSSHVRLTIYNMVGQEVKTLVNDQREAGSYQVDFAPGNIASGVYYYTLTAGDFVATRKMLLLK